MSLLDCLAYKVKEEGIETSIIGGEGGWVQFFTKWLGLFVEVEKYFLFLRYLFSSTYYVHVTSLVVLLLFKRKTEIDCYIIFPKDESMRKQAEKGA